MEDRFKICPECGAEYFAHITRCAGCEVALIFPEEKGRYLENRPRGEGELVCIEEGEYGRIVELSQILKSAGIEHKVLNHGRGGHSCSGGSQYGLFVQQSLARFAARAIDDELNRLYPELRQAEERMNSGLCPACGSQTGGAAECPDCGLNLGGGGIDGCGGGGCGSGCS